MDINQNQANIPPVSLKPSGVSAVLIPQVGEKKEKVVNIFNAESLTSTERLQKEDKARKNNTEVKDLSAVVANINKQVQAVQRYLEFSIDEKSGREVVTIKDLNNDKIIKQIPSEEMLAIARNISKQLDGNGDVKAVNLFSSIA